MRTTSLALLAAMLPIAASAQQQTPRTFDDLDRAGIGAGYERPEARPGQQRPNEQPFKPRQLSVLERWRLEACLTDAAKAPTRTGVAVGVASCQRRFNQIPE